MIQSTRAAPGWRWSASSGRSSRAVSATPSDVGDVLQDIYVRIQAGAGKLRDTERFGPWVYQVARSVLVDHGRARARRPLAAR